MANPNNIILRSEKGAHLSFEELDGNFVEFQNLIYEFNGFISTTYANQQTQINDLIQDFEGLELNVGSDLNLFDQRLDNMENSHGLLDLRVGTLENDVMSFHIALLDISNLEDDVDEIFLTLDNHLGRLNGIDLDLIEVYDRFNNWIDVSSNITMEKNRQYMVNFNTARTLTLPSSPTKNDKITIHKVSGNPYGSVIARNGRTIMGLAENLTINMDFSSIVLVYTGSTWRVAV